MDYNATVNLPKTAFPMRAGLPAREPGMLKAWEDMDLYHETLRRNEGKPLFVLHDGPPFSNGNLHMGHALNKCLKDFICRYKSMTGYKVPYTPGWDNHGMPIESAIIKEQRLNRKAMSVSEFRSACHRYAEKYVDIQREGFKRLGVLGDWDHPYLTMNPKFEAEEVKVFGKMYEKGYIYKGKKPVYWCPSDETALAEAEIEYAHGYAIAGADETEFTEALEKVKNADVCILTLGGKHGSCSVASMGEGVDATDINLPPCQDRFIEEAAKIGKPLIGVHFNGRPISSDVADEKLDAILEAWNPSEAGAKAIVRVLKGEENPSGRLPVCVAYNAGQIPIFYNHVNGTSWHQGESIGFANYVDMPHTPRYYFGYGLSYTTFEYSDLQTDRESMAAEGSIQVTVKVSNTGKVAGTDVVQMYVRDVYASMVRPEKELAGFARVTLLPGETKTVQFILKASQLAFLTSDMKWKIEKGAVDVMIGKSCNEIELSKQIQIENDAWIDGAERGFYARSEVEKTTDRLMVLS